MRVAMADESVRLYPTKKALRHVFGSMKTYPLALIVAAMSLAACDSKEEKLRKQEMENKADQLEDAAKAAKEKADRDADAIKKQGELDKERLKNEAEKVRDQK